MTEHVVLSAIELIRKRPEMFFGNGKATVHELVSAIVKDASVIPDCVVEVWRRNEWTMVCADVDWMVSEHANFEELFERFVLPTPLRPNSHRAEILVAAACERMLTVGSAGTFSRGLSVGDLPPEILERFKAAKRAMVWTM